MKHMNQLRYDGSEWTTGELRAMLAHSLEGNGWNDPDLDAYDFYCEAIRQNSAVFQTLPHLSIAKRMEQFSVLVRLASCGHGHIQLDRDAIVSLPRDWVLARIEAVAEPLLAASCEQWQFEEYRRLLELYEQLGDSGLVRRLAERAIAHQDEDVREAGRHFLERCL
jgi:hypothetical protein